MPHDLADTRGSAKSMFGIRSPHLETRQGVPWRSKKSKDHLGAPPQGEEDRGTDSTLVLRGKSGKPDAAMRQ